MKVDIYAITGQHLETITEKCEPVLAGLGVDTRMGHINFIKADLVTIDPDIVSNQFLREHTHTDIEARYIEEGCGTFWFHIDDVVYAVECVKGDTIVVPPGMKHWFTLTKMVTARRFFTKLDGWIPDYTDAEVGFFKPLTN